MILLPNANVHIMHTRVFGCHISSMYTIPLINKPMHLIFKIFILTFKHLTYEAKPGTYPGGDIHVYVKKRRHTTNELPMSIFQLMVLFVSKT